MSFELTAEQEAIRETAQRFARERLLPQYQKADKSEQLDRALVREMGELGLIGMELPEEFGGMGVDGVTAGVIIDEIGYGDLPMSYVQLLGSLLGGILAKHANPDISREWLPRIVKGEALVALGLTEPGGGSDAASLKLSAVRSGNGYVLSGEKTSMSMSTEADAAIIFARTGAPEDGARGVSGFFVDLNQPGITRTRFEDFGTKSVARGSAFFDDVFVPPECLIGDEGRGFTQIMSGFDYSRALIALECHGAARASLDETWQYVQEREAFGAPIAQYQGVTFPLAEAETQLTMLRLLAFHTLSLRDNGKPHTGEAAMCKWYGPKVCVDIIHQCLLTHGHYGYTMNMPHQQRLRDVMGLEIGDGTAQIQKLVIAREKIGRTAVQYSKEARQQVERKLAK
ncbi:MAG: acyl-CoA dehydrogenase family protein [Hyphomicrobiaceae bacterium]|nr:acyl-CoA dehydrogenase family protein [Hyphomicrobiaceae bacterium]